MRSFFGHDLAKKLDVELGTKLVLSVAHIATGEPMYLPAKVVGIFKTGNPMLDKGGGILTFSSLQFIILAISSVDAEEPCCRMSLAILAWVSVTCTGRRTSRPWFCRALIRLWRIHHVAYVENFRPRSKSNFCRAVRRPWCPSWTRSPKLTPFPTFPLSPFIFTVLVYPKIKNKKRTL